MLQPVPYTPEFQRIERIPRRVWTREQGDVLSKRLTPLLATPAGIAAGVALRPLQALGLQECFDQRGLVAALAVSEGKSLLTWQLPIVMKARRPVLVIPANMVEDTQNKFAAYAKHWIAPRPPPRIESYNAFTTDGNRDLFWRLQGDLFMFDEGDLLRNYDGSVCERYSRFLEDFPETNTVVLTGTLLRNSMRDFAHLLRWCLRGNAPVPSRYVDVEYWCSATDNKTGFMKRCPPGALLRFASEEDHKEAKGDHMVAARLGLRRRFRETPGLLITTEQATQQTINIRLLQAPEDPILDKCFEILRTKAQTPPPDDYELVDPLSVRAVGEQLGVGFYYHWEPRGPYAWMQARKDANKFVRSKIGTRDQHGNYLDTIGQVIKAYPDNPYWLAWKAVEKSFIPESKPRWMSLSVVEYARQWLEINGPAVMWTQHNAVGEALSRISGVKFFGAGGLAADGTSITHHPGKHSAILSLRSNRRGRNLQDRWHRAGVLSPPQPATDWEQGTLGRLHRTGQLKGVQVDVIIGCAENLHALNMAYREAHYVEQVKGQKQKLLICNVDSTHLTHYDGYRWAKD